MTLSTLQQSFLPIIEGSLQDYLQSMQFGHDQSLKDMLSYHMGWSNDEGNSGSHGKRIRPLLMLLCTSALNGEVNRVLPAAVSIEFLHNFTLIHDDIEDRSPTRHGRPTLWERWGIAKAINAGDALFSIAQLSMLELRKTCHENITAQATFLLNEACLHLTLGQHLDLSFENDDEVAVDAYLEMIGGKTAALIALATQLSGLILDQAEPIQHNLFEFGKNLGLAFQIQDDALGIWGDPDITGKSAASDIRDRKKTLPIIYGLQHNSEFQTSWGITDLTPEEISYMADMLEACGAKAVVQSKAKQYTDKAYASLEKLFPNKTEESQALFELSERLLNRKY